VANEVLSVFDERLVTYSNTTAAHRKVAKAIAGCRVIRGTFKGFAVTGTVHPMSFSHFCNASVAYLLTLTSARFTLKYDYPIG
jgi:hypothetical protein